MTERYVFPPRVRPIRDAGIPNEAGQYPDTAPLDVKIEDPIVRSVSEPDARVPRRDPVEHPEHYEVGPCEAHEARAWLHDRVAPHDPELARAMYEAGKYCWRAGLKGDAREDCRKARWYLAQLFQDK